MKGLSLRRRKFNFVDEFWIFESTLQPTKARSQLLVSNDGWTKICFQQTMNVECSRQRLALCNVWLPGVMMQRIQATQRWRKVRLFSPLPWNRTFHEENRIVTFLLKEVSVILFTCHILEKEWFLFIFSDERNRYFENLRSLSFSAAWLDWRLLVSGPG